jgi:hypothetical protein
MNLRRWIFFLIATAVLGAGCGDDTSAPDSQNPLDPLQIDVIEACLTADRLTPNPDNPGALVTHLELELLLSNGSETPIRSLFMTEAALFLSDGSALGRVRLDHLAPIDLGPQTAETISVTATSGQPDLGEGHCGLDVVCRLEFSVDGWTSVHELPSLLVQCVP